MEVQIQSSTTIPKANPDAEPIEIPITVFDRYAPKDYIPAFLAFDPPTPPNSAMIDGLAKTLLHFPTLTGRLGYTTAGGASGRRPCVLAGGRGGGALVVEATVASNLADHLPLEQRPEHDQLCPLWKDAEAPPLLQVQLNRFDCGGLIIVVANSHRVADGQSMSNFYIAWAQAVRGVPIDPLPVYDRTWLKPRSPPRCDYEHWGMEFMPMSLDQKYAFPPRNAATHPSNITNILLHYSPEFIAKLKRTVKENYTIFELLLAHLWRKITTARGLDLDYGSCTTAKLSVNGRRRLKPTVPKEYFGNFVLTAYPSANAQGLIVGGLAEAARTVHEAILNVGEDYFRSFIDFGAIYEEKDLVRAGDELETNVLFPDIDVYSLLGFQFHKMDFGGGGALRAFMLGGMLVDGVVMFIPSLEEEGGIDVFVDLFEVHATILRQISHSLD